MKVLPSHYPVSHLSDVLISDYAYADLYVYNTLNQFVRLVDLERKFEVLPEALDLYLKNSEYIGSLFLNKESLQLVIVSSNIDYKKNNAIALAYAFIKRHILRHI